LTLVVVAIVTMVSCVKACIAAAGVVHLATTGVMEA
jgi:hypothetical protein